jgi:hypothetical protein
MRDPDGFALAHGSGGEPTGFFAASQRKPATREDTCHDKDDNRDFRRSGDLEP